LCGYEPDSALEACCEYCVQRAEGPVPVLCSGIMKVWCHCVVQCRAEPCPSAPCWYRYLWRWGGRENTSVLVPAPVAAQSLRTFLTRYLRCDEWLGSFYPTRFPLSAALLILLLATSEPPFSTKLSHLVDRALGATADCMCSTHLLCTALSIYLTMYSTPPWQWHTLIVAS
jgi:hypothetical protein